MRRGLGCVRVARGCAELSVPRAPPFSLFPPFSSSPFSCTSTWGNLLSVRCFRVLEGPPEPGPRAPPPCSSKAASIPTAGPLHLPARRLGSLAAPLSPLVRAPMQPETWVVLSDAGPPFPGGVPPGWLLLPRGLSRRCSPSSGGFHPFPGSLQGGNPLGACERSGNLP